MKSIISINTNKFKKLGALYLYNQIKDRIDGAEIYFDFTLEQEQKFVEDLIYYFIRDNYYFQFHGNSDYDLDMQKQYLNYINELAHKTGYKINIVMHTKSVQDLEESFKLSTIYIDELEDYIEENNLDITLSIENLNSIKDCHRLSKDYIYPILYNNLNLYFTYDIGHELGEYGKLTDLAEIEIKRLNNIHLHTFVNDVDHQIIKPNSENIQSIIKSIIYLKNINYNGPIVYEYDLLSINGSSIQEKLEKFIKSIEYVEQYYK